MFHVEQDVAEALLLFHVEHQEPEPS